MISRGGSSSSASRKSKPPQSKWRTGTQQKIYGRRLLDALRATRGPSRRRLTRRSRSPRTPRRAGAAPSCCPPADAACSSRPAAGSVADTAGRGPRKLNRRRSRSGSACWAALSPAAGSCPRRRCSRRRPTTLPRWRWRGEIAGEGWR
jgi:hypothetical protein